MAPEAAWHEILPPTPCNSEPILAPSRPRNGTFRLPHTQPDFLTLSPHSPNSVRTSKALAQALPG